MNNRIYWIDWAKAIGIMIVVFCHIPQYNTIEKTWLCSFQMPLFFFLSGYLHKLPENWKIALQKYWKALIIPYLLFQPIFYPYWLMQKTQQEGLILSNINESVFEPFLKCLIGIPIDGITWFIVALLIMKIMIDLILRSKYKNYLILLSCIISIILSYMFHKDDKININFAIDSMFDFYLFFILGYIMKQNKINYFSNISDNIWRNILYSLLLLLTSIIIIKVEPNSFLVNRIFFYVLGATGTFCIISLFKSFKFCPHIITTISKGTIILLGLHWMFIGTTNFFLEKSLHLCSAILYTTFEATLLVLAITIANYYIIIFCQKRFKIILGGRE